MGQSAPEPAKNQRLPLSVFIIALNEADRIGAAIRSVSAIAREIVVVDSGSEDETCEVAGALGARVIYNDWAGFGPQKRFAEDQCAQPWLLNLDADERLSPEAQDEIRELFAGGPPQESDAFRLKIRDRFFFEERPAWFAFTYNQIRLYRRDKGRFADELVHDSVILEADARLGQLQHIAWHDSQRSLSFVVDKMNYYSTAQAELMLERGKRASRLRLMLEFPLNFLKAWILRRYALYGIWGVIISANYGYSRLLRLAKLREAQLRARRGEGDD